MVNVIYDKPESNLAVIECGTGNIKISSDARHNAFSIAQLPDSVIGHRFIYQVIFNYDISRHG